MDYFNKGERIEQTKFAAKRDQFFRPVVTILHNLGIAPSLISILGALFGVAAAMMPPAYWYLTASFLVLYVLMDGIDGPLARLTNQQSEGGSLVDIFADQIGVMLFAVAAVYWLDAHVVTSVMFAFFYINNVYLMVVCNLLAVKMPRIVRVKYPFFLLYLLSLYLNDPQLINVFTAIFLVYYFSCFMLLFRRIFKRMKKEKA